MSSLRPRFHLTPAVGRLNDPNGVYLDGNILHVYYQHDPQWPFGAKRTGWGHATTTRDDPTWQHFPDALAPLTDYDLDGCYSGSAVMIDGELELFYTGNAKPGGVRRATQNLVTVSGRHRSDGGSHIRHPQNPLIEGPADGFTAHYRDPHVTYRDGEWVMVLGAQRADETGHVALYTSQDRRHWDFAGPIEFDLSNARPGFSPDLIPGGYMWECPNLFSMVDAHDGHTYDVLLFLPQGMSDPYPAADCCGYVVGHLNGNCFTVTRGFTILDFGHEFYAPQIASNSPEPLLIGWMGLPAQDEQPTKAEGWVHALTMVRRLELIDGHVWQQPWASISSAPATADYGPVAVWQGTLRSGDRLVLTEGESRELAVLHCGTELELTRGAESRVAPKLSEDVEVLAIVDGSCLEIFAGGIAFSSRVFYHGSNVGFATEK
ncbi:Sucrose-6-phosphate hydrolase [Corynebacterium kalinowskii]|uniref:beta-fructofuranosidase n=1 Tax=Corynebacterium kalinowskii TaxID=2675216 RepID=A0A6B8VHB2_9CORY|nr:glycoside hydrolase family 32 protein [Corynebacterium kalinowskii]QGU02389.1 Sucrose-6-phosphate hydrolase [Corynebacterium kalinowskii]